MGEPMDKLLLALDYGGTKHTAAILRVGEQAWAAHSRVYSPHDPDASYDQATMRSMAHGLMMQVPGQLAAIGVSFGGPVDAQRGLVRLSHHVPGWEETPLRQMLESEFGVPVAVDNDANVAAFGEWRFGAGQGATSLLYVTVSTGIGGGWVLEGRVWSGADGMAGEIGHVVVNPGGMPCVCGQQGCLEAEACGPALAAKARDRLAADPATGPVLAGLASGNPDAVTGEMLARAAAAGDPLALAVLDEGAAMLGAGLGGAINLVNPQRVVLGGGVTKSGDRWWRIVRETARHHVLPQTRVEIIPAAMSDDAPLWGAAALAEKLLNR